LRSSQGLFPQLASTLVLFAELREVGFLVPAGIPTGDYVRQRHIHITRNYVVNQVLGLPRERLPVLDSHCLGGIRHNDDVGRTLVPRYRGKAVLVAQCFSERALQAPGSLRVRQHHFSGIVLEVGRPLLFCHDEHVEHRDECIWSTSVSEKDDIPHQAH
jgi:hypothetical protein